jgi:hypothetical protein
VTRGSALRLAAFAREIFLTSGFRFCGLAFAARIHWLESRVMPREKTFICEIILSAATPLRTIPQLCKANEGCKAFGRETLARPAIINFGKV